ncbi:MAG: CoA transferase, partial [Acidimicrobiia bacterium]|nr:CoA transferase [Acidimicrobiia bacterium]
LTGRPNESPLGPPAPLVSAVGAVCASIERRVGIAVDGLALLAERAAIAGFRRGGDWSCGRATRLLKAADNWVAVALARPDDINDLPAWLEGEVDDEDPWTSVEKVVCDRPAGELVARATLLSLPVAELGADARPVQLPSTPPSPVSLRDALVVDFSSLWAGPLCSRLLQRAGARVIRVESQSRPDGARRGPPEFFDALNAGKESVVLDFERDTAALHDLIGSADVVVEASRPRALEQFGISAKRFLAEIDGPRVWVSITGYGRSDMRVAFGDDAAVAGGLVVYDDAGPCFCADAIADPLSGLVATDACLAALGGEGPPLIDLPMAGVAAAFAGPTLQAG